MSTNEINELQDKINYLRDIPEDRIRDIINYTFKNIPMTGDEYKIPSYTLLKNYRDSAPINKMDPSILKKKLAEFGFYGEIENVRCGPLVSRYEMRLASGVKLSQIRNISEDLAVAPMSDKVRIQAPIPNTSLVGIEIANEKTSIVGLKGLIKAIPNFDYVLPMAIGVDTVGNPAIFDLVKMPHLLIAGQTGSGKSVCLNSIILSILFTQTPNECKLVLVDPKRVEMSCYSSIPHLWKPIVTEPNDAVEVFNSLTQEMESRYKLLESNKVRNIGSYNSIRGINKLPYIVAVVDEMADLIMTSDKDLEHQIVRLAQLSRAVGIHLILATQKPIVKVITGLIKSNMPSRISFQVSSKMDSRVILDCNGAEKLMGRGDMLMIHPDSSEPERFHGAWVSDKEIEKVVGEIR